MAFLTPDTAPSGTLGVVVFIPDDVDSIYTLLGLLDTLSHPENWEKWGDATPEEIAPRWAKANDDTATENLDT
jgi:hypothetical protein